jgi:hypothetical protein
MSYHFHFILCIYINCIVVLLYRCFITNALHAYVDCVTNSISIKIYGSWINMIWYDDMIQKLLNFPKCDNFLNHLDFVILYGSTEGKINDMIWYDMIWYDMIWYDMIWYDMIWYDMIWYDMIWYMIWWDLYENSKLITPFITSPLTYICNKSLSSGIFPSRLKFSEIKPLHKKGDGMDITNFRPIYFTYFLFIDSGKSDIFKIVPTHQSRQYIGNQTIWLQK